MVIERTSFRLKRRRTKIVATLGPASREPAQLRACIQAGVNVFRMNMSHGGQEEHAETYHHIRRIAKELRTHVAVMADLCGPKIRVGVFEGGEIVLEKGAQVVVTTRDVVGQPGLIPSQYASLAEDLKPGEAILLADGLMELRVDAIEGTEIQCTVKRGGVLGNKKGMNLPGVKLSTPSLTEKDRADALFALGLGVDYLALSFVREARDVEALRELCRAQGAEVGIIAKIEKPQALEDIDEILRVSDAIMVARGDLGVELPAEQVPIIQDELVRLARLRNRPVIVATQMLESMVGHSRPTRAEVSDVSHAVSRGADAVMLSGETAVGRFPVAAIEAMDRIARQTEGYLWRHGAFGSITSKEQSEQPLSVADAVGNATSLLSRELQVRSIVVPSTSGTTARIVAASRPAAPLIAASASIETCRRMCLIWGIVPIQVTRKEMLHTHPLACALVRQLELATEGQHVLLVEGFHPDPVQRAPSMTILTV